MTILALLRDAWLETLDRTSLRVMAVLAGLGVLFCAGLSFRRLSEEEALQAMVREFPRVSRTVDQVWWRTYEEVRFRVVSFAALEGAAGAGYRLRLQAEPAGQANRLVRHWQAIRTGTCRTPSDPVPEADVPVEADLKRRFLESRFREGMIPEVEVQPTGDWAWDLSLGPAARRALGDAEEMRLFFGAVAWRPRLPAAVPSGRRFISSAEMVYLIEIALGEFLAGWVGLLVAVVVTAGSVPSLLRKGTIDLVLARPMGRSALLVARFAGGCLFVLVIATLIVGGSWLAISLRTGHWNLYFPLTILTLTFFFAVLYSVSVLVGVLTRSHAMAAAMTLLVWLACYGVGRARLYYLSPEGVGGAPAMVRTVRIAHAILPRTGDLSLMNQLLISRGGVRDVVREILPEWFPPLEYGTIVLTSSLFAALMLALACAAFAKRDL